MKLREKSSEAGNDLSAVAKRGENRLQTLSYSPYGYVTSASGNLCLGFNGQPLHVQVGGYILGNGYRIYSPALMRFQAFDQLSPFGPGGINGYCYTANDPVNRQDPTGRIGVFSLIRRVLGNDSSRGRFIAKPNSGSAFWDVENQLEPHQVGRRSGSTDPAIFHYEYETRSSPRRLVSKRASLVSLLQEQSPATDTLLDALSVADRKNLARTSRLAAEGVVRYMARAKSTLQEIVIAEQLALTPELQSQVALAAQRHLQRLEPELHRNPAQAMEQIRQQIV
ncbi:RHS repeat-associated core domain-containing protein [Pseudomonas sp.]|uniref:RHS repeat-associated core domain-containing protein n=1 Tax=Pseudomonas sp. TaxID=306 RepID=UPI0028AD913F|nr:RHS repeat-associated core domain-containing protein [Pseudomonas sp.]